MASYTLNFKNAEGVAVNPQIHWLKPDGTAIYIGNSTTELVSTPTNGTLTFTNDAAEMKFKFSLAGYADKTFTAVPGVNDITMQKSMSLGAAADTAKNNWWKIALVIALIILAVWAYKKYYKK